MVRAFYGVFWEKILGKRSVLRALSEEQERPVATMPFFVRETRLRPAYGTPPCKPTTNPSA